MIFFHRFSRSRRQSDASDFMTLVSSYITITDADNKAAALLCVGPGPRPDCGWPPSRGPDFDLIELRGDGEAA